MLEVETKYKIDQPSVVIEKLEQLGAVNEVVESHADTYLRHPCRDFVQTKEALRIRRIDGVASVTYKGPKLAIKSTGHDQSALKARKEIEWCLAPADSDGNQMTELFLSLGFETVATVCKQRRTFQWPAGSDHDGFSVTVDEVEKVGTYAEIELLVDDEKGESVEAAGERIHRLAETLGLDESEKRSYLSLLLSRS
ncbi:class IV adenylate cyclase [Rhodopirellula sp. MGV]|uniref:class IV adenylate cyclase n=1 Tax=Rhodopirellula sp. MGV TaxID=2023130 RepID=UPI000B961B9A|nr:class IV adenylate cyclase [Rhodopirellula sp. MGV]OYP28856.1 hypothetical protein CGZ80_25085 [Rhodopirellula sp. MGV]PNY37031.1 class IV adenylate cyclase [Rhodopirellula baltica]